MKDVLLFARVGREKLPNSLRRNFSVLTLPLSPRRKADHFHTDAAALRATLGRGWNARAYDLLNLMCALRAADRYYVSRGLYQVRRRIPLAVGVTDVERWQRLSEPLRKTVFALGEDMLDFYPVELSAAPKMAEAESDAPPRFISEASQQPDSICLYSGGADSFAGAAYLLDHHRHPALVSHSVGPVSGLQKQLFKYLCARFPDLDPAWLVQVRTHPNAIKRGSKRLHWKGRDHLQRLRSMFFFSIAAIVAQAIDVDDVFMCENGLIGAAIVFSPRDDNPFTTRPAEPRYLRTMQEFLRQALDRPSLSIRNPFQYMTKGEVLSYATQLGLRDALYLTVSCWRSGNCGLKNCGQCVPCLFRQLAFDEAGLPPPPRRYGYRHPIPSGDWREWNSSEIERLEDLREYCGLAAKGGVAWLMGNELAVIDAIDVTGGPVTVNNVADAEELDLEAPRRMAKGVLRFARAVVERLR